MEVDSHDAETEEMTIDELRGREREREREREKSGAWGSRTAVPINWGLFWV